MDRVEGALETTLPLASVRLAVTWRLKPPAAIVLGAVR